MSFLKINVIQRCYEIAQPEMDTFCRHLVMLLVFSRVFSVVCLFVVEYSVGTGM